MTRCSCHPSHRLAWIHALGTLILPVTPPQARGAHSKGLAAVAGADLPSMRRDHRWLVVVMPPPTALAGRKVSCLPEVMVGPCGLVPTRLRPATDDLPLGSRRKSCTKYSFARPRSSGTMITGQDTRQGINVEITRLRSAVHRLGLLHGTSHPLVR